MGSLEEEKLLQMVHDFIESSSDSNTSSSSLLSPTRKHAHSTTFFTLQVSTSLSGTFFRSLFF